jgi:hypothetical protein
MEAILEEVEEAESAAPKVLRYDEDGLSREVKRKIVRNGIEQMEEVFPHNNFPVEMKHIFKCKDCHYISTYNGTVIHRRRHHRQAKHKCPYCPREYVMKCEMERHKQNHLNKAGEPVIGIVKDQETEISTVFMHRRCFQTTGNKDPNEAHMEHLPFRCKECNFKGLYSCVALHVRHEHLGVTSCCQFCEKVFDNKISLEEHEKKHLSTEGEVVPIGAKVDTPREFSCTECGQMFRLKQHMERHFARKHAARLFECTKCNKSYSMEMDLQHHIKLKHSNTKSLKCDQCSAEFACKAYLRNHFRRVHAEKCWLQCPDCKKMCKDAEALQRHM